MLSTKRMLILAPHTDDGELGCGATIAKYAAAGTNITYVAFSTCAQSLPEGVSHDTLSRECKTATQALGIKDLLFHDFEVRRFPDSRQAILDVLVRLNKDLAPDTVFLPARNDVHQDHQVIFAEGLRAFKYSTVLGYELPWNNVDFAPTFFEKLDEAHLAAKQAALQSYHSQAHRHYMKPEFTAALATVRGVQCNALFAEAFEIYRLMSE